MLAGDCILRMWGMSGNELLNAHQEWNLVYMRWSHWKEARRDNLLRAQRWFMISVMLVYLSLYLVWENDYCLCAAIHYKSIVAHGCATEHHHVGHCGRKGMSPQVRFEKSDSSDPTSFDWLFTQNCKMPSRMISYFWIHAMSFCMAGGRQTFSLLCSLGKGCLHAMSLWKMLMQPCVPMHFDLECMLLCLTLHWKSGFYGLQIDLFSVFTGTTWAMDMSCLPTSGRNRRRRRRWRGR